MIYIDTSVALAQLFAEDRKPPPELWSASLVSSRLIEYDLWNRVHAYGLGGSHGGAARELLGRVAFLELVPEVLKRSLEPFPSRVRTLDALHLASFDFLQRRHRDLQLASFDDRMASAASELGFDLFEL